nr:MAG TPA: hypothetical protein [Caudoviricetes sp.]
MEQQSNKTRDPLVIQQFISNCIAVNIKITTMDRVDLRVFDDQYNAASVTGIGFNSLLSMLKMLSTALKYTNNDEFVFLNEEKTMVAAIGWCKEKDVYSLVIDKYTACIYSQDVPETENLLDNLIQKLENIDWAG